MGGSILDDLGQEVTGIVSPVTICMAVTVLLVRALNPEGASNPSAIAIAQTYYKEKASDPVSVKFEGALINSLIFVLIVGVMTFVLFLMFKYGCESCIWGYMAFAAFQILFLILGVVALQLVQLQPLPIDAISFVFVLWNFSVVGTATMFMWPAPVLMKQMYMIVIGVIMAYLFTGIPEWTTWILLLAMAAYDIVAVLTPNGPLKLLVELAQERDAQIPALVYEARSTGQGRWSGRGGNRQNQEAIAQLPVTTTVMAQGRTDSRQSRRSFEEIELTDSSQDTPTQREGGQSTEDLGGPSVQPHMVRDRKIATAGIGYVEADSLRSVPGEEEEDVHFLGPSSSRPSGAVFSNSQQHSEEEPHSLRVTEETADGSSERAIGEHEEEMMLPDGIKLGLGDFIFYSVLVGRAAMYDWLTVFACYLAIVAGLGATLICLALYQAALPALPISITLGVIFYFFARLIIEPVLLPMSMRLLYF